MRVRLGRREDGAAGALDRVVEREVLARLRRLGELDVVDDLARARAVQRVDRLAVPRARERPLQIELRERDVVDRDDDDVRRWLRAARLEPAVDRRVLERVKRAAGVRHGRDGARDEPGGRAAAAAGPGHRDACEVGVPGLDDHGLVAAQVAHGDDAATSRASACRCSGPWSASAVPRTVATLSLPRVR